MFFPRRNSIITSDVLSCALAVVNVFAADTHVEAKTLMSSMQLQFVALRQGNPGLLPEPVKDINQAVDAMALAGANHALKYTAVGTSEEVNTYLSDFIAATEVNEVMLTCHAFDHKARLRSFEIAANTAVFQQGS